MSAGRHPGELAMGGLLDLLPSLADGGLPGAAADALAGARVPVLTVRLGPWSPQTIAVDPSRVFALLVADGLLLQHHWLSGTASSELLGPGDLISPRVPAEALVPMRRTWHVAQTARLGVLDARLAAVLALAPLVGARLLARAVDHQAWTSAHRAIVALPRVEDRILALFGHLAERWGRVASAGLVVPLALTHEAIGQLIGARRPTVSLGLKTLAEEDLVGRRADGSWLIAHSALHRLAPVDGIEAADAAAVAVVGDEDLRQRRVRVRDQPGFDAEDRVLLRARVERLAQLHPSRVTRASDLLERCRVARETSAALQRRLVRA